MSVMNIYEAKTHLSELINRVISGEEVIIARAGKPLVQMVPFIPRENSIQFGLLKGKIKLSPDFNTFNSEMADMFKDYLPGE